LSVKKTPQAKNMLPPTKKPIGAPPSFEASQFSQELTNSVNSALAKYPGANADAVNLWKANCVKLFEGQTDLPQDPFLSVAVDKVVSIVEQNKYTKDNVPLSELDTSFELVLVTMPVSFNSNCPFFVFLPHHNLFTFFAKCRPHDRNAEAGDCSGTSSSPPKITIKAKIYQSKNHILFYFKDNNHEHLSTRS
jgi:hypothetical protein